MPEITPVEYNWDGACDVVWTATEEDQSSGRQTFVTLYEALDFVMLELQPVDSMLIGVYAENSPSLFGIEQIKDAWRLVGSAQPSQR